MKINLQIFNIIIMITEKNNMKLKIICIVFLKFIFCNSKDPQKIIRKELYQISLNIKGIALN